MRKRIQKISHRKTNRHREQTKEISETWRGAEGAKRGTERNRRRGGGRERQEETGRDGEKETETEGSRERHEKDRDRSKERKRETGKKNRQEERQELRQLCYKVWGNKNGRWWWFVIRFIYE